MAKKAVNNSKEDEDEDAYRRELEAIPEGSGTTAEEIEAENERRWENLGDKVGKNL